jgi:hypothetical protein
VDVEKFQLKVSRNRSGEWMNDVERIDLPDSVLDLSRTGPTFTRKQTQDQDSDSAMDSEQSQG